MGIFYPFRPKKLKMPLENQSNSPILRSKKKQTWTATVNNELRSALSKLLTKRRVFISYHHKLDQYHCDFLSMHFSKNLKVFTDRRLDEPVRSDDPEYVIRKIREDYIQGSSITIVLCGKETHKRKYVDWEIASTLHHEHAILGIRLPGCTIMPERLYQNYSSGYAHMINWNPLLWKLNPSQFIQEIKIAIQRSNTKSLIRNSASQMARNLS